MGIRAEIGMPSFFYRVVIVELVGWNARAGRQDKARGSDHVGEPKRSRVDDSLCRFLVVEMPNAHI